MGTKDGRTTILVRRYPSQPITLRIGGRIHTYSALLEARWAYYLTFLQTASELRSWAYEPHILQFDRQKWRRPPFEYKPDFITVETDGSWGLYETKGFIEGRDVVKLWRTKDQHPQFRIFLVVERLRQPGNKGYTSTYSRRIDRLRRICERIIEAGPIFRQLDLYGRGWIERCRV